MAGTSGNEQTTETTRAIKITRTVRHKMLFFCQKRSLTLAFVLTMGRFGAILDPDKNCRDKHALQKNLQYSLIDNLHSGVLYLGVAQLVAY